MKKKKTCFDIHPPQFKFFGEAKYYPTSDLASVINDEIQIIGRDDDIFTSGGKNISLNEIQATINEVLQKQNVTDEFYLASYPHEKWGQTYGIVFIVNKKDEKQFKHTLDEIRSSLSGFLKPNKIVLLETLENKTGIKPSKGELVQILKE